MKRIICLVISVLMLVTLFAGCGTTGKSPSSTTAGDTSKAASTVDTSKAADTQKAPVELVLYRSQWGDVPLMAPADDPIKEEIKKKFNITLEIVGPKNPTSVNEKFWVMVASGEQIDIANIDVPGPEITRMKNEDVIIPLNDLMDTRGQDLLKNISPTALELGSKDEKGTIWNIPYEVPTTSSLYGLGINVAVQNKYNFKNPETIQDLENILKLSKKENMQPLVCQLPSLISLFAGDWLPIPGDAGGGFGSAAGSGIKSNYLTADGKVSPWFTHEKVKDFLTAMQNWYKNDLINKDFAVMNTDQYNAIWQTGKSIAILQVYGSFPEAQNLGMPTDKLQVSNFKAKLYMPVKPPSGPADSHILKGLDFSTSGDVIMKMCKNPDRAMDYINYTVGTIEGFNLCTMGVEGKNFNFNTIEGQKAAVPLKGMEASWWLYTVPLNKIWFSSYWYYPYYADIDNLAASFPSEYSFDYKVKYDFNKFKSKDKQADMNTMISEAISKIIMGASPVSSWDDTINKWKKAGGDQYIEDLTEQYNASPIK